MAEIIDYFNSSLGYICRAQTYNKIADFLEGMGNVQKNSCWGNLARSGIEYGLGELGIIARTGCGNSEAVFFDDFMAAVIKQRGSVTFEMIIPELTGKLREYGQDIEKASKGEVFPKEGESCIFFRRMAKLVGERARSLELI